MGAASGVLEATDGTVDVEGVAVEESGDVSNDNMGSQRITSDDITQNAELEEPDDKPDNTGSNSSSSSGGRGSLLGDLPPPLMSSMAPNLRPPQPAFDSSISDELDDLYDFDGST